MKHTLLLSTIAALSLLAIGCYASKSEKDVRPASVKVPEGMRTAVVGAGCFWCVEAFYESLEGVNEVVSGYAGGSEDSPTYYQVARGETSHAEVVQVIYDPEVISYRKLIDFFWTTHDATRSDGVWPDFGLQYRSILLYQNNAEREAIASSRKAYESNTGNKIATEIKALDTFYPAEGYHQNYAENNPHDSYVRSVLQPKLKKLGLSQK
ncbi:peptide-methionine (S)-S-oxide reductase MsrA [Coraliomargarita sp. SDUM461004]|uniref:Peptide methionine sulfoxide reductase MsrA n=1 Tax=Thalassobacterium sedimentorum TaxID=3041258 RepID=A0ABU1AM30_9BACT|nr:peptide-methionine (S)-S-oxide reductase MsrA [Coraliomargarita sp. SDUM461004]MDQ8195857.1 peptide-methionine (S)-S-oxide reductase MsrA [Coraliomargarita sp. SDUM461004]